MHWYDEVPIHIQRSWEDLKQSFLDKYDPLARGFIEETSLLDRKQHKTDSRGIFPGHDQTDIPGWDNTVRNMEGLYSWVPTQTPSICYG